MANGYIRKKAALMAIAATINVTLNIFLIPVYGAIGAAVATCLTEVFLFISYAIYANTMIVGGKV